MTIANHLGRWTRALCAVGIVWLYACGGEGSPGPNAPTVVETVLEAEARSIDEIAASGPPQVTNITATDAVLQFESTLPLACVVVYGTTAAYGSIATDQDMTGGAHRDHTPVLTGLQPDTQYHYRVQGSASDGTFYLSGDMTFRTPPEDGAAELNLASPEAGGRVRAVSSNFGGAGDDETWGALSAVDGSAATAWSSDGDGDDAFIEFELDRPAQVEAVTVWSRIMADGSSQIFEFTLTTDAGVHGPYELRDTERAYRFPVDAVTRVVRLDVVTSSGGNTGLVEFGVFGTFVEDE